MSMNSEGVEANTSDKPVPREITALLSGERVILRETQRAATPFGGVTAFIACLQKRPATHPWLRVFILISQSCLQRWRSGCCLVPTEVNLSAVIFMLDGAEYHAR
jgi:hypothetical protein